MSAVKPFTVLLMRPDYIADVFGQDSYLAHVTEENASRALWDAQREAWRADNGIEGTQEAPQDTLGHPNDYHCLAVFEGHLQDIKP